MKFLVFGASGQLGQEWQAYFKQESTLKAQIIPYRSQQLNITDFKVVEDEFIKQQPDVVINCAAYTDVDGAETERDKARLINADAVQNMAELCAKLNIKLVHFSTDFIFAGEQEDQKRFPNGYPEDHVAAPVNWYGQTKWEGEQAIRRSGCAHLIMRISWLCGTYGSNFVKTMLRLAGERDRVPVVDDQIGSPTFTDDLVENTACLIENDRQGTYHYTTEGQLSWADLAEAIFEIADLKMQVNRISSEDYQSKAARPFYSKLSTDKITRIEGITTENWQTGLKRLIKKID